MAKVRHFRVFFYYFAGMVSWRMKFWKSIHKQLTKYATYVLSLFLRKVVAEAEETDKEKMDKVVDEVKEEVGGPKVKAVSSAILLTQQQLSLFKHLFSPSQFLEQFRNRQSDADIIIPSRDKGRALPITHLK